ncbi:zinc finger, CCHC-type containing protein [Tanacetum coccineum]
MAAAMKHMVANFLKLDKFEGVDFQRWQKKMYFLLSIMSVVYVLTTPMLEDGQNATVKQIRKRNKWKNDDYVCRGIFVNGSKDEVSDQHSYCFNFEDDPKTFDEAMKSWDVSFWKEVINDEMDSIMGINTWVLTDLPICCKPLSCKWIFKRKLKVDGTIEKFKARLVIEGFRQNSGICYFDTYAPVDLTKEFLSSRFSMKDLGEVDVILGIRIEHESNGIAISQSHYIEKVLKKSNYSGCTLVSTPMDTSGKLMPTNG